MPLTKIVSGGQTGVDRGALDAALAAGFPCGGWCPEGRLAEDGAIADCYPVAVLTSAGYEERTLQNVLDSGATAILHSGKLEGGTRLTAEHCARHGKPHLLIDASTCPPDSAAREIAAFVEREGVSVLNVAGQRASKWPGARDYAYNVVSTLLRNYAMTESRPPAEQQRPSDRTERDAAVAARFQRAIALHQQGQLDAAATLYREIVGAAPAHFDALHLMGVIEAQKRQFAAAVELIGRALEIDASSAAAHSNLGNALKELKRYKDALASYDRALALDPRHADALNNRGNPLRELKRYEEALASHDRALEVQPDYPEALNNRGLALHELDRDEEALASYNRALQLRPDNPDTLYNRAIVLCDLNRHREALADYARVVQLRPDHANAHWNESLCRLLTGDFESGWRKYEWRWQSDKLGAVRRSFPQPAWSNEEPLEGRTILLHAEQGLGDTIQFCRYATLVAARGARVVMEVQPPLKPLLGRLRGVTQVVARGEQLPRFDCHCPLLALPLAFNTRLETIPASMDAYLHGDPARVAVWRDKLGSGKEPRIGLVWAGRREHSNDRKRSIAFATFGGLITGDARFFSLQKELSTADEASLRARKDVVHIGDELTDFEDTAAAVECMDLVITVDTSVAHLAGAMAKPVWILLPYQPDWRWLLGRSDSPWYRRARLFRQPAAGHWSSVIAEVGGALRDIPDQVRRSRNPG